MRRRLRLALCVAIAPLMAFSGLEDAIGDIAMFSEAVAVLRRSGERKAAYEAYLKAMDVEESAMSSVGVAMELDVFGTRFYFDRYGQLHLDDRFVLPDEHETLYKVEAVFRRLYSGGMLGLLPGAKVRQTAAGSQPVPAPRPVATGPACVGKAMPPLASRDAEVKARKVPIFRGFEDARYQQHDALILRCVEEFNRDRASWSGSTPAQARGIYDITPALVKAHMIEETGGKGPRSRAAWPVDPEQINVPGDWSPQKSLLGLKKPVRRNEGTAEQNVRAAIKFLVRKGFGISGQPAANRPTGTFDGWFVALQRYNGRSDETLDGRAYRDAYADRITRRALDPGGFVPISTPLKSNRKGGG